MYYISILYDVLCIYIYIKHWANSTERMRAKLKQLNLKVKMCLWRRWIWGSGKKLGTLIGNLHTWIANGITTQCTWISTINYFIDHGA